MPVNQASGSASLAARETAMLMASLMRGSAKAARPIQSETLLNLLSDPVRLSAIVRQAGLELEMQQAEGPPHLALQSALARVSPQHLERLVAVLARQEQPAVNPDPTYGETAALGEAGSSRGQPTASLSPHHQFATRNGTSAHDLDLTASDSSVIHNDDVPTAENRGADATGIGLLPHIPPPWQTSMQLAYHPLLILAVVGAVIILMLAWR